MRYYSPTMRIALLPFLASACTVAAQQAIPATGGEAEGSSGSVSWTVGQVAWTEVEGANGTVAQGVQQAYTLVTVSITEPLAPALAATIGPNPTNSGVVMRLAGMPPADANCQLLDATGKVLRTIPVSTNEVPIPMDDLPAATYLLTLLEGDLPIHVVKIIKH